MGEVFEVPPAEDDEPEDEFKPLGAGDVGAWSELASKLAIDPSALEGLEKLRADWASASEKVRMPLIDSKLFDAERFELPDIPPNPAHETNELLSQMVAASMAAEREAREERERERKHRRVVVWISAIGTVGAIAAAVFSGLTLWL